MVSFSRPLVLRFSFTQLKLRAPAWYGESSRFATTPSRPRLMLSSSSFVSCSAESVFVNGAVRRVSDLRSSSCAISKRRSYGSCVRSDPSRNITSNTNARSGAWFANSWTPSLRRRAVVSWKGTYSSDSGLYAIASPSRMTLSTFSAYAAATSSGKASVHDSRFLEKMLTSPPALWIWTRSPSYLGCTPTIPSFLITASGLGRRSAS